MKKHLFALFALAAWPTFASTPNIYVWTRPCTISIQSVKHSGEKVGHRFTTRLANRNECRQLADLHRPNFEGEILKSKRVHYLWNVAPKHKVKATSQVKRPKFIKGYSRLVPKRKAPVLATFRRK